MSVTRKKTNLSHICLKSELNSYEIGLFQWYFGDSSDRFEENGSQKDTPDFFVASLLKNRVGGNFLGKVGKPKHNYFSSRPNSPGVKFAPTAGFTSFTWDCIGKNLEISMYLAIRPRLTKFCM